MTKRRLFTFALLFGVWSASVSAQTARFWKEIPSSNYQTERTWMPDTYKSYLLNPIDLKSYLSNAPLIPFEQQMKRSEGLEIELPMPDGTFQHFRLAESPIMEKGLADKFPDIKTYAGYGVEDLTAYIRCDFTQFGFHAYILSEKGTLLIDPYTLQTQNEYLVYYKHDVSYAPAKMTCELASENEDQTKFANNNSFLKLGQNVALSGSSEPSVQKNFGGTLRTYRLALACTGEYAAKFGGTVTGAMAAMVISMNRVNGVYEKEVNVHMNMIANNDTLIFLVAASDPYTNNNGSTMLGQNKTTINDRIGSANYDIGHVFSTGGGGIASLGSVCGNNKAQGVTGSSSPSGDGFDIDYVAHEMGHQFAGSHTFNSVTGSCSGNRSASAAYEPGSGTTIMAYAGICGSDNIMAHSDAYFHAKSLDQISNFLVAGGNSCAAQTPTNNNFPTVSVPVQTYYIPIKTPFTLTANGSDPNGDPITFCWEQYDLGSSGTWNAPSGNAPLFRTYTGKSDSSRTFPLLTTILAGLFQNTGEVLPTYARDMEFRCTVRDNKIGGGAFTWNDAAVAMTVINTGTPFRVATANTTGVSWAQTSTQTVTWDVSGTTNSPISTANVNILLSINGGMDFPYTLAANTPNDGNEAIIVPSVGLTTQARIKVEAVGNVYFDINDKNFSLVDAVGIDLQQFADQIGVYPNPSNGIFEVDFSSFEGQNQSVEIIDMLGKTIQTIIPTTSRFTLDLQDKVAGVYLLRLNMKDGNIIKKLVKN